MNDIAIQTPHVSQQVATAPSGQLSASGEAAISFKPVRFIDLLNGSMATAGALALGNQLKKAAETNGTQMGAELFAVIPMHIQQQAQNIGTDTLNSPQSLQPQTAFAAPVINSADVPPAFIATGQTVADGLPLTDLTGTTDAFGTVTDFPSVLYSVASSSNAAAVDSTVLQYDRAIIQAQHILQNATDKSTVPKTVELDVDELQQKVNAGAYLPQFSDTGLIRELPMTTQSDPILSPVELFDQIKTASTSHIQSGDKDFAIKLSPEGLGEIIVRLTEESGKVTLSLTASNANVQRLLNNELSGLRDIMRPYHIEVTQVTQSNASQSMDMQQQFHQQFTHSGYQQQQSDFPPFSGFVEDIEADPQAHSTPMPDAVLDAYV